MTGPVSTHMSHEAAYVDPSLTASLHKVSWGAVSAGAMLGFFALVLGAVAARFAGSYGTKRSLVLADATTRRTG